MMKQLLYIFLFLLFSCKIFAQDDIRIMGAGIGLSSQPYVLLNGDISTYYNSFHKTKLEDIYLTTGTKANYSVLYGVFSLGQRFGLGVYNEKKRNYTIYNSYGIEVNTMGYGIYANKNIIFGKKKHAFTISPEISFLLINHYGINILNPSLYMFLAGCSFSTAWKPKEFVAKQDKKYGIMNHFSANIMIGSFNRDKSYNGLTQNYYQYIELYTNYKFFKKQIISPEAGLGLIVCKGKQNADILNVFNGNIYDFKGEFIDIIPYFYSGFSFQTRNKLAFILNAGLLTGINMRSFGYKGNVGIKYSINNKLAISLSPTISKYAGFVYGKYEASAMKNETIPYNVNTSIKGLHESTIGENIYSINIGVHF